MGGRRIQSDYFDKRVSRLEMWLLWIVLAVFVGVTALFLVMVR